jgi:hypothetical protein
MIMRITASSSILVLVSCLLCLAAIATAQKGGRFEEAKRQGLANLENMQFDRAAGHFEDIWEQDQTDPTVAENLAIAYLNGEDRRLHPEVVDKAHELSEQAIRLGGRATFLVQHSHEIGILTGKTIIKYCSGRMSITPGKLTYVGQAYAGEQAHTFEASAGEFTISAADSVGQFQIKLKSKKYSMIPRSRVKADGDWMVSFIRKHVEVK